MATQTKYAGGVIPCNVLASYLEKNPDAISLDYSKAKPGDRIAFVPLKFQQEDGTFSQGIRISSEKIKTCFDVQKEDYKPTIKSSKFPLDNFSKNEQSGTWEKRTGIPEKAWTGSSYYNCMELLSKIVNEKVDADFKAGIIGKPVRGKKSAADDKVKIYAFHKENPFFGLAKTTRDGEPMDNPFITLTLKPKRENKEVMTADVQTADGKTVRGNVLNCDAYDQTGISTEDARSGKVSIPKVVLNTATVNEVIPSRSTVIIHFRVQSVMLHKSGYGIDVGIDTVSIKRDLVKREKPVPIVVDDDEDDAKSTGGGNDEEEDDKGNADADADY